MPDTTRLIRALVCFACLLATASASILAAQSGADERSDQEISLDDLYTLPRITGTPPENYAWSADASHLAFLWNDEGLAFRDLWVCEARDCEPRRLTHHAAQVPADSLHGGIGEIAWQGSADQGLIYVLDGRLHAVDSTGEIRTFEHGNTRVRQLQRSPDGRSLTFVNGGPIDRRVFEFHPSGGLWLRSADPAGSPAREIVPTEHDVQWVESYAWSPDGSFIVFVMADRSAVPLKEIHYQLQAQERVRRVRRAFPGDPTTSRRIGVVEIASGDIHWLDRRDELRPVWGYGISSDASRLFVNESDFLIKEHVVDVYDLEAGTRTEFYRHADPANVTPGWQVAWAPADEGLVILTDRDGYYHLYHQREPVGTPRQITRGEWEIEEFSVDIDTGEAYFVSNQGHPAERHIYRVRLDGGEPERLSIRTGTHRPVYAPDHSRAAIWYSNDSTPPDLYLNDLDGRGEAQRITSSPLESFDDYEWADVRYPTFRSHIDGTGLIGRLLLPPDFDPDRQYPLIVGSVYANTVRNTWGGGSALPIWGLDQHLVSRGYLVLSVDVRGSWGHGRKFSQGLLGDYGGIDTDDIASGVRHLIEQGIVDPDRVGIWGWSYGGLMTLMSLSRKPELYAVGVADAPATNVWHAFPEQMWVMGERKGPDYPERYERLSALYQTEGIEDPVMILHGTADAVVFYADSIAFIEKMMAREALYEFVPIPGTTHVWAEGSLARQRFGYKKIVEFFDRHLQPCRMCAK